MGGWKSRAGDRKVCGSVGIKNSLCLQRCHCCLGNSTASGALPPAMWPSVDFSGSGHLTESGLNELLPRANYMCSWLTGPPTGQTLEEAGVGLREPPHQGSTLVSHSFAPRAFRKHPVRVPGKSSVSTPVLGGVLRTPMRLHVLSNHGSSTEPGRPNTMYSQPTGTPKAKKAMVQAASSGAKKP